MSNLIGIGFDNEADAFAMRAALVRMQQQYLIEMEDAVVVARDHSGKGQGRRAAPGVGTRQGTGGGEVIQ